MPNSIARTPTHDNPFAYGGAVSGRSFTGRERELGELLVAIRSGRSAVIHSERRMGKSSILAELASRHSGEYLFALVDMRGVSDGGRFAEVLARKTLHAGFSRPDEYVSAVWDMVESARLRLALIDIGRFAAGPGTRSGRLVPPEGAARPTSSDPRTCGTCGMPLKWIASYRRFYCYKCKRYVPTQRTPKYKLETGTGLATQVLCFDCGGELTYVDKFGEYYCEVCRKYPLVEYRAKLAQRPTSSDIAEALDLPEKVAKRRDLEMVVMLDEFQEVLHFDDSELISLMAERLSKHESAHYIFSGCNWCSLKKVFLERQSPMHRFAHAIDLRGLQEEELQEFLMARFRSGGGRLSKEAAERLVKVSRSQPYYAQQLAHELFHISRAPGPSDVEAAIALTLDRHALAYSLLWESVRSPLHRRYLIGIATEPGAPKGKDFIRRHGLKSRSHVQRIEKQLSARGIVNGGAIVDPMLTLWLKSLRDAGT